MTDDRIIERFADSIRGKKAEELELLALKSPAVHFALYVTIKDKKNVVTQPTPNILQLRMSEAYETLRALGVKARIICVKPRQVGCSSFAAHIGYHHAQRYSTEGITISDIKAHSQELKEKLAAYSKVDTFPWGNSMVGNPAQSVLWDNGSKWTIDTAENPDAGVGGTRQFGHFSEVAKWPQNEIRNDKKTMSAVLPSLSGDGSVVIVESTPEGAFGFHHDTWQTAVTLDKFLENHRNGIRPDNQWVKVFAAWFEFPEHRRKEKVSATEIEQFKRTLSDTEKFEIAEYKLDWEQIGWRRDTIENDCNKDPKVFSYYFPSDDVTCWLASGSPRFDMTVLVKMRNRLAGMSMETGELVTQHDGQVGFQRVRDGSGMIWVWDTPKVGLKYLVCCDPAGDITQSTGADPDRHSVAVWRRGYHDTLLGRWMPAKMVARLKPPYYGNGDEVASYIIHLSKFYGRCIIALETNFGTGILRLLKLSGLPLYKTTPVSAKLKETIVQYGFRMDNKEIRNRVIDGLAAAIQDVDEDGVSMAIEISCPHAINEHMRFVRKGNGRAEAAMGAKDDDVLQTAIAWEVMDSATEFREHKAKHADPADRSVNRSSSWRSSAKKWK